METELKARLDDQLGLTEFHLRLCLVRVTTRDDIPTINLKKDDKAVETVKVWPALNFRSHRELLSEIEKSVRQESKKLFAVITLEYQTCYTKEREKRTNDPKHWGVAYLLGRQDPTRPMLSVYPLFDEMNHVFSFEYHVLELHKWMEMPKGLGEHCHSVDFRDTFKLCDKRMIECCDNEECEETRDKTFSQVEHSPSYYEKARRDKKNKEKTFFEVEYSPTYHKKGAEQI